MSLIRRMVPFLLAWMAWIVPASAQVSSNEDCLVCHADKESGAPYVSVTRFRNSIHGRNLCISCHSDIQDVPHQEKIAPVQCSQCHRLETEIYLASDHGRAVAKGIKEAASCKACHGESHYLKNSRDKSSPVNRMNVPKTCARCHENSEKMKSFRLGQAKPYASYLDSVHGKALKEGLSSAAVCTDCHGSHDLHAPLNPISKMYKFNVPKTCGKCHENVFEIYSMSIHGKAGQEGIKDAPVCTDCHGEHTIRSHTEPDSSVYTTAITKTCSNCHAAEKIITKYGLPSDRTVTYMESYHGLAAQAGSLIVANCASCHGYHDVLPSNDSRSSVNPKNLSKTCGKCHPGVGALLAKGSVHLQPSREKDWIVFYVTWIYILLIVLVIGGMAIHNALDFFKKLRQHYRAVNQEVGVVRLPLNERIQHMFLFVTFTLLAYTGFVYKYPQAWWSLPFSKFIPAGMEFRKILHRASAVIFMALMAYHVIWSIVAKQGRKELGHMMPKKRDFTDFLALVGYNLGLRKERPHFDRFNYIEKSEYWALVWGAVIMALTGILLWFENVTLRYFPKWVVDVALTIHLFEAILATLAILVWHFYWTVFDPDIYPMNPSWLSGKSKEERSEK